MTLRASRKINQLSAAKVRALKVPGKHADGGGLYLVVDPSGAKRWMFKFRWKEPSQTGPGKQREMGLGSESAVSLARAREKAAEARAQVAEGQNPIQTRQVSRRLPTFGELAETYIAQRTPTLDPKSIARWRRLIFKHSKALTGMRVDAVSTSDVLDVLRPLWAEKAETAGLARAYIEAVLDAGKAQGLRSGENPARWRGHLANLLPRQSRTKQHFEAMPFGKVPDFMKKLRAQDAGSARPLEFLILTAARTGAVIKAHWREIDFDEKVWTAPAENMKKRRDHRTPLSERALEVLLALKPDPFDPEAFIFPGGKVGSGLSNMAMNNLLDRMKVTVTTHGFRSSFTDWAYQKTEFPVELVEEALAHMAGDETTRAYRRGDALERRRVLMYDWARFCAGG